MDIPSNNWLAVLVAALSAFDWCGMVFTCLVWQCMDGSNGSRSTIVNMLYAWNTGRKK